MPTKNIAVALRISPSNSTVVNQFDPDLKNNTDSVIIYIGLNDCGFSSVIWIAIKIDIILCSVCTVYVYLYVSIWKSCGAGFVLFSAKQFEI